jgi:hypothetical protein
MQRSIIAAVATPIALLATSVAIGAPDNKNTSSFTVTCEGVPVLITTIEHANGSASFTSSGVAVVKRISGSETDTFAVEGGPTLGPFTNAVEEGANGGGFEDRLVACDFELTFTDTFTANKRFIAFFDLDPSLTGAEVTVTATITGTAWVVSPGQ